MGGYEYCGDGALAVAGAVAEVFQLDGDLFFVVLVEEGDVLGEDVEVVQGVLFGFGALIVAEDAVLLDDDFEAVGEG